MTSRSRLMVACIALLAVPPLATPAFAQAGSGAATGAAAGGAPQAPTAGAAAGGAVQPPPSQHQPAVPDGCPYRDGKLELIV
jgi:hypothetical protein